MIFATFWIFFVIFATFFQKINYFFWNLPQFFSYQEGVILNLLSIG
ncbi:hypothetical protein BFG60_1770 [Microcystis aeruginosa NIES-98]|nr:hypothetical protein BFG60_1770 [Microcystis aeruginosa NIES-98]